MDLYVGRLQTHAGGYGFVTPERPLETGGDIRETVRTIVTSSEFFRPRGTSTLPLE